MLVAFRESVTAYHAWRTNASWPTAAALVLGWAGLMGLLAQLRISLPFTPVPFTMQIFGVLLGAVLLGRGLGTGAQGAYVAIGAAGVPWFQNLNGGWAYLLGPTGGYLVAFPLVAFVVGTLAWGRFGRGWRLLVPMLAGVAVVYAVGAGWLAVALGVSLERAFWLGVAPFIVVDVGKAVLAAGVAAVGMPIGRA